mgnify:CR=1 FL=1
MTTKGEYRVGIDFNPSGDDLVGRIKRAAADLIDLVDMITDGEKHGIAGGERARLKALAQEKIEDAAMSAVKAATKEAPIGELAISGDNFRPATDATDPFMVAVRKALQESDHQSRTDFNLFDHVSACLAKSGFPTVAEKDLADAIHAVQREKGGYDA